MKFLCLHGAGTSGSIFKAQTAAFRARLPPGRHTFDFIDGPHELSTTTSKPSPPPETSTSSSSTTAQQQQEQQAVQISPFFPPPYYTFLRSYTDQDELDAAPEYVLSHIRREIQATGEPYDACLCFSQGASVAAGVLMRYNAEVEAAARSSNTSSSKDSDHSSSPQPPPFKAILFICGGPPLPILESLNPPDAITTTTTNATTQYKIPQKAWDISDATAVDLARKTRLIGERLAQILSRGHTSSNSTPPPASSRTSPWDDLSTLSHDAEGVIAREDQREIPRSFALNSRVFPSSSSSSSPSPSPPPGRRPSAGETLRTLQDQDDNVAGPLADVYGLDLRPASLPRAMRILGIPTAHVYGVKDPRYTAAIQLALMCDPDCRRVYDTRAGHEIPREKAVSDEIADMIQWLEKEVVKRQGEGGRLHGC